MEFDSLKDIFLQVAKERKKKTYGEEAHLFITGWIYNLEYHEWDMHEDDGEIKSGGEPGERIDHLISYQDSIVDLSVRETPEPESSKQFAYTVRYAYLDEQVERLKQIDSDLARALADAEWVQADEKHTEVWCSMSWYNYNDVYQFLRQHIQQRYDLS